MAGLEGKSPGAPFVGSRRYRIGVPVEEKMARLKSALSRLPGAIVAFSGGADSAFLAEVAHRALNGRSRAVTADSPSLSRRELTEAEELARGRGWNHSIVSTFELRDERYVANDIDRCYFCKTSLFERLEPISRDLGWPVLLGTNVDDQGDWRPGQKAADERGALHPLLDVGFTKAEIRRASQTLGLETAQKPASACLASRFAYGVRVTAQGLARVEEAEEGLLAAGFRIVRVRDLGGDMARVEVGPAEVRSLLARAKWVTGLVEAAGFLEVILDERGYRQGRLNEGVVLGYPRSGVAH